ncbi:MAG: beta-glucuronidase [Bacteroidota bacterium]
MLYPQHNPHRTLTDLGGFWQFRPDPEGRGQADGWAQRPLPTEAGTMRIAVPGAWNDQLAERGLKNYVGAAWYETTLTLPARLTDGLRVVLYVSAADHRCAAWCNGQPVGTHEGGFLPFALDLTEAWQPGAENRLSLWVDSTLTLHTLPQGVDPTSAPYDQPAYDRRHHYPPARFDFFPYGGLTRPVYLQVLPEVRLQRLQIEARLDGRVSVHAHLTGEASHIQVTLLDPHGQRVGQTTAAVEATKAQAALTLDDVHAWCPATPHLYTARVQVLDGDGREVDQYDERFGVREVRVEAGQLLLNDEPLYLTGFGKHEDFPVVGRGQFRAAYLRDFELMRWVGANSFRTSHYPYDQEMMRLADELGFLVIGEVPAVSLGFYSDTFEDLAPLLETHKRFLTDLVWRDQNHPSVIAWSVVNEANLWAEPHYQNEASRRYFAEVCDHTRALDATRPTMAITFPGHGIADDALQACDLIGINRYYGWYSEPTDLARAEQRLSEELDALYAAHEKPILMTEFGVDTLAGAHSTTAQMFSEEFQDAFVRCYNRVLESKPFCMGAHLWNFADFHTPQNHRRVVHNLKGAFTRSRTPKRVAFMLREHWRSLDRVHPAHRPAAGPDGLLIPDLKHVTDWAPR